MSLRHRMPDHTISVPAPLNTKLFGIPNACNECHKDKSADWSEARLADWFPKGRREQTVEDAIAFTFGAKGDPLGEKPLVKIADDPTRPPLVRANALGYLRKYPSAVVTSTLLAAAREAHPVLRVAALLSLTDRGRTPEVRRVMETALNDPRRTVRMASALGLLNAGLRPAAAGDLSEPLTAALNDHALRADFLSDDPATQLDLGKMFFLAGNWKQAESSVRDALKLDPKIAGGNYFLALATLGQGRVAEGAALLRRVDRKDPHRKDADAVLARLTLPP